MIGKLDFPDNHPMLDHFRFLKKDADAAHVTAKMTIPSPAVLHFRGGRKAISKEVYPDLEEFYLDLGKTYRKAARCSTATAGAAAIPAVRRHRVGHLCSQEELQKGARAWTYGRKDRRGASSTTRWRIVRTTWATTSSAAAISASTWISSGGYEPVAETMLAGTNYDAILLEDHSTAPEAS